MVGKKGHIRVDNLTMAYGQRVIQRNLNFDIYQGDIFVIMGGSGCGKSTLLKHMIGLMRPARGDILYAGQSFWRAHEHQQNTMRQRWGITYQSGGLFSTMTLAENIALPLQQYTDLSERQVKDLVAYKLSLVGLGGYETYYPAQISGGMQKRAALARAMALDPDILFFDEPSAGLDPLSSQRLDALILKIHDTTKATVVIVTHELASIFAISNNAVFLDPQTKSMLDYGDPHDLVDHSEHAVVRQFLNRGQLNEVTS